MRRLDPLTYSVEAEFSSGLSSAHLGDTFYFAVSLYSEKIGTAAILDPDLPAPSVVADHFQRPNGNGAFAVAGDGKFAIVSEGPMLTRVNLDTDARENVPISGGVTVSGQPATAIAMAPDGKSLLMASSDLIRVPLGEESGGDAFSGWSIPGAHSDVPCLIGAYGCAVSPDGKFAIVTRQSNADGAVDGVSRVDLEAMTVSEVIVDEVSWKRPSGVAIARNGTFAIVVNKSSNQLIQLRLDDRCDLPPAKSLYGPKVLKRPDQVVLSEDDTMVVVSNGDNTLIRLGILAETEVSVGSICVFCSTWHFLSCYAVFFLTLLPHKLAHAPHLSLLCWQACTPRVLLHGETRAVY